MSISTPNMDRKEILRIKLTTIRQNHADLDASIAALEEKIGTDRLMLQRLKRQKLALKDEIRRIEDALTPDIIA